MTMTIRQELALSKPLQTRDESPDSCLVGQQGLSATIGIRSIVSVDIMKTGPVWHVSLSVYESEVGALPTQKWESSIRRLLRDLGYELLRGVGIPADGDTWELSDKAVHLFRPLRDNELGYLPTVF